MDHLGPTPEQMNRDTYEAPEKTRKKFTTAYRRQSELERMTCLEPEHIEVGRKLYENYWGMQGADVRKDERTSVTTTPDEFRQHACGREVNQMKNVICSARIWEATLAVCAEDISPTYVGHVMGKYKSRAQAKAYGDALVLSGLDILATYYGLRPPDG